MQRQNLTGLQVYEGRAGIAAQRRAVVTHGRNHFSEAFSVLDSTQCAGLQPLDTEDSAKQIVLHATLVSRIERGVSDCRNLDHVLAGHFAQRQDERTLSAEPVDGEQRHVPVGVDHHDPFDLERRPGRPVELASKIDSRAMLGLDRDASRPRAGRKDRRDMTVGHDKALAHDKAGASVRIVRIARKLDPSDRGKGRFQSSTHGGIVVEFLPERMIGVEFSIHDIEHGPYFGQDYCFDAGALLRRRDAATIDFCDPSLGGLRCAGGFSGAAAARRYRLLSRAGSALHRFAEVNLRRKSA